MSEEKVIQHTKKAIHVVGDKEKSWAARIKEFLYEILIIVIAVSITLWMHNWNDKKHDHKTEVEFLKGIKEDLNEENLKWIEDQLANKKIIAIGEIGLDYYRTFTPQETQKYWFKKQLELAKKYDLPVLLHIREAFTDVYEMVKEAGNNKGILHCFTGTWETAQKFMGLGFYISFAGNITYQNGKWKARWQEVIEKIPLEKIVIETDAPYLSPEPLRGKINYPQNIVFTLKKIAEIKGMKEKETAEQIYSNALRLFDITCC